MATEPLSAREPAAEDIKAVPVRHPGRWVAAALVVLIAVSIVHSMATNKNFGWSQVGHFLFDSR
ncbi:MAG: amino acid ABC transporter permease, partial [Solirubrobacteraceae bacterium]